MRISPPSDKFILPDKKDKCLQLNAQDTNILYNSLSNDVVETIKPLRNSHLI